MIGQEDNNSLSHTNTLSFLFAHSSEFLKKSFMKPLKGDGMFKKIFSCVYMMCKTAFYET